MVVKITRKFWLQAIPFALTLAATSMHAQINTVGSLSLNASQQRHIKIGTNAGMSPDQLEPAAKLIEKYMSKTLADCLRKLIEKPVLQEAEPDMMVRIAEIEIVPQFVEEYKSILKQEAAASIKLEPGVIAIFPMYEQKNHTQVKIVEIYSSKIAYQSHLKTPHFLHYKTNTAKMVKSLKLIEMESIDSQMMVEIFKKLK